MTVRRASLALSWGSPVGNPTQALTFYYNSSIHSLFTPGEIYPCHMAPEMLNLASWDHHRSTSNDHCSVEAALRITHPPDTWSPLTETLHISQESSNSGF